MMVYLSIVIPVRNEERFIGETLRALSGQDYPKERFELIIVDGRSTDGTRSIVAKFMADNKDINMRLLDNPGRLSSMARNIGARAAAGKLIGIIDGHVYIPDNQLFVNMERLKEVNNALCLARPAPLLVPTMSSGRPFWIAVAKKAWLGHSRGSYIYGDFEGFVDPISSGFAYDRAVFERVGFFDETFDAAEDVEFNFRLKKAGIYAYTSTALTIYSYPRETLKALFRQQTRYGEGRARFIRKHTEGMTMETFLPMAVLFFFLSLPVVMATRRILPWGGMIYAVMMALYWLILVVTGLKEAYAAGRVGGGFLVAQAVWMVHMGLGWGLLKTVFLPESILSKPYCVAGEPPQTGLR